MKSLAIITLIAIGSLVAEADAGCNRCCCNQCGCGVKKVCRLKCEMKPSTTFRYECKCDDYCTPGPSKCCGKKKVCDCQALLGFHIEHIWQPRCGCVRTRKLLVKVPVTKQVPVYTCEVVTVCGKCGFCEVDEKATAEARAKQIIPVSAEVPLVLEDDTDEVAESAEAAEAASENQAEPPVTAAPSARAGLIQRVFSQR